MLKAFDNPRYDSLLSATNVLYAQRKFNQLREINARGEKWEHCGPIILSASYTTTCHGRIVMEHLCITHEYQSQLIQMCMFLPLWIGSHSIREIWGTLQNHDENGKLSTLWSGTTKKITQWVLAIKQQVENILPFFVVSFFAIPAQLATMWNEFSSFERWASIWARRTRTLLSLNLICPT